MQQTERSCRCALSPNHELAGSGCQHQTVSILWTAQMSRAQDIATIYLPGCIAVWNPSKRPRRSSLGDRYLSHFVFCIFSCFIQKITQSQITDIFIPSVILLVLSEFMLVTDHIIIMHEYIYIYQLSNYFGFFFFKITCFQNIISFITHKI